MQLQIHSIEAEKTLLGQMIIDNNVIDRVGEFLPNPEVFYDNRHRRIWETMSSMRRNGEDTIDVVTIMARMPSDEYDKDKGYYMTGLVDNVAAVSNAESYAKVLYEKWLLRSVIMKSKKIQRLTEVEGNKAYGYLQMLHSEIENILNLRTQTSFDLDGLVDDTIDHILAGDSLLPFGYKPLDNLTGGMTRGEITVIAGRPGHFKSTMMLNIVRSLLHREVKVLVINREMSNVEMMKKLLVMESSFVSYDTLRNMNITEEEKVDLNKSRIIIKENFENLIMYDNIFDIERTMREIRKHRPDVVVDDYIGLADVGGIDDNRLRVDSIMKQYKRASKTYNMCSLIVSQLNRDCESRANKRPILRDLRDSGSIEQDAEMILFMYFDWRYDYQDSDNGENELEVILGKNRYGRTGSVKMGVVGDRCSIFDNVDEAISEKYRIIKARRNIVKNGS